MTLLALSMLSALKDQKEVGGEAEHQTAPKGVAGAAERMLMLKVDSVAVQVGRDATAPVMGFEEACYASLLH